MLLVVVGCLTSQQHASVSQRRICSDNFTCCHIEIEVADQTFYLTQSQYIDTGPTSPSVDSITPGAWQGSHWSASFSVTGIMTRPGKIPSQAGFDPRIFRSRGGHLNHSVPEAVHCALESVGCFWGLVLFSFFYFAFSSFYLTISPLVPLIYILLQKHSFSLWSHLNSVQEC